ncbi:Na/Pi cotransporter family protein, partial [Thalassolituus sp. UBA2107]
NIGTTVTANLAAMVGNVHAKRAARFHLIFNLIGVAWMLAAIYPVMHLIDMVVQNFSTAPVSILSDAPEARPNATLGLSLFHTSFNILNVILLFAFIPYIVRFIERILPETAGGADDFRLKYISAGVMTSPALALEQAQKEAQQFAGILNRMHADVDELLFDNKASRSRLLKRIAAAEEATDQLEIEISDYLVRVSENTNLEHDLTERIRFLQTMINDMERIADIYFQISKLSERLHEARSHWPDDARADMVQMMEALRAAVENMQQSASMEPSEVSLERAIELENRIDELRDSFRDTHFLRLENGDYSPRAGVIFIDVLNRIERIGDHILNVNESAANHRLKAQRV